MTRPPQRTTLMVPIKNRDQFLDMYYEKGDLGGIFIGGATDLELGHDLDLEVSFLEEQMQFRLRGTVRWRRPPSANAHSLPPGVGIEFSTENSNTRQLLLDYAMGREVSLVHRDNRRFPATLSVKAKSPHAGHNGITDDISVGGALLLLDESYPVGTELNVVLRVPGRLFGLAVRARVAWSKRDPPRGVGVEFIFESAKKKDQLERVVEALRIQTRDDVKVRVPRR